MKALAAEGWSALQRGDWERAENCFEALLREDPSDPEGNLGMGRLALAAGYPEDVLEIVRQVERGDERLADLEYSAYRALRRGEDAIRTAGAFLESHPEARALRVRLGTDLLSDARAVSALEVFRQGRELAPDDPLFVGGEAAALLMLGRTGECRKAVERRLRLLAYDPIVFSQWVALHAGDAGTDEADMVALAGEWDRKFGRTDQEELAWKGESDDARIRIGFVSSTFRHHANCQFLLPLLEAMDRRRFELICYHDGSREDEVTARCRKAVDRFRSIHGMDEGRAVSIIRGDRVAVLFDINAHFDDARMRLFTHRMAPVQAHYLGGVGSTGLTTMDWRLADDLNEPPGDPDDRRRGSECIHRIAGGIHAFRPLRPSADPDAGPASRNGFVTLGCLNALPKVEDHVLSLWARCLRTMPDARLRLVKDLFRHRENRDDFSRRAAACGIPAERLDLVPAADGAFDDLSIYHGIDIALDTFPYNGITTTCEALWMGVPVVALRGRRFVAREAAGILERVGHPEWIAENEEGYIERVRALAADPGALAVQRHQLRDEFRDSPVHDAARLAGEMEGFIDSALGISCNRS